MVLNDILLKAISWTLVHSVWQGFLLAFCAGLVILFTKKSTSVLRYNLLAGLFVVFLAVAGFTFQYEFQDEQTETVTRLNLPVQNFDFATKNTIVSTDFSQMVVNYLNHNANIIVLIWFLIFSVRCFGIFGNLSHIYRIRNYKTQLPSKFWQHKITELSQRIQLNKTIVLLESRLVKVPSVTGFFKPMILIPVGLLSNLPQDQIEAILLHELAHIRRKDYVINILQSFAEILFFFNPGVLWLSSILRDERENCCDDIAIAATESKVKFVNALVSFEAYNLKHNELVMGFGGNKNHLLNRAKRIIHNNNKTLNSIEKTVLSISLVCIAVLMIACSNGRIGQAQREADRMAESANGEADLLVTKANLEADQLAAEADQAANAADAIAARADQEARLSDADIKKADAEAARADVEAKKADDDLKKANLESGLPVAKPALPAKPANNSKTVRTVTSNTRTEHSVETEKTISTSVNNEKPKTVSLRTGITGKDLPENINTDQLTQNIISDLLAENIISNTTNLSYKLSNKNLIVNGVVQPENKYRKVKEKYIKANTFSICYNYEVSNVPTLSE